ncbi:bifunctional GTP diphosphokinase/guanosine-3',5'-bis pyrophosphate 3'-pyrophosphohydrolase [Alloalcanivorax xenomutans]|uniref:guanosine-3',5'-bis(diphosphate) 3'-diphosphatase n=1 Tax=Alloalcanivorax xenomutans TaxID=1094342 RepID=A0A9Q3ZG76_9GAMM|nr:bifunctional GTP diphosphokinase/guanosine-3',5'-bis pyrophosphate 3'-pyrophosphohydrolase [Alloalcanivorax xenomutans]ARB44125.1 (p)ppGpp synthetase [Alloalcanivorax xenomutans]MCE7510601.1 bifunctional GTP diphosphokinase/guanosine-3',5'-bis pyrophosphate 3'-pyrophosphohydrolase [Alloalcanivorax xenomutans]PHS71262.1 MAG: bifunctional GTP diphosphokinase/guanosine-3',5'-bis(diphosphate) 3'-diphosphatase [Alcanivorax sp.]CUR47437.1 GTP pyrophosphokinase, (p)ppGpp synthetase II / Guanosine-3
MSTIHNLEKRLRSYLTDEQIAPVVRAYYFAETAHEGQYRRTGDPYITHPLAVANILTDMHMDHASLMAAMLHDVIEDTGVSKEQLATEFSEEVAELVDGVSKIAQIKFESKAEQQAENLRKMILAMTRDIRVILVKLADRLHNMRTLHVMNPDKRRRIATETLEIYAPIAFRLGMYNMRVEYEDLAFHAIHPMRARLIGQAVRSARGNRKEILSSIKTSIEHCLQQEGIEARVLGREKHLYSIYNKMKEQHKPFSEIMDVFGFRIIVDRVDTCYRVLGAVHNYFIPIPGRFKDYVAIPKANGYQSLHTTLKAHSGIPLEIQIRTEEMEAMANNGIAAHWLYKTEEKPGSPTHTRAQSWMQRLLEMQQKAGNSMEFIENVKVDLFPDEAYVFTPKGDIKELPAGATPVDFAYAVHTKVGNRCVAARVDGKLAALSTPLESGQTVKIITAPNATPNPAWLNFVVTGKARSNIRHFLKQQRREDARELGQRLLDKALAGYESSLEHLPETVIRAELNSNDQHSLDELLEDIGMGNRLAPLVARKMMGNHGEARQEEDDRRPLAIRGSEGLMVTYAKCCYPLPGDTILGHLSAGRGIVVHRDTCKNLLAEMRNAPEKCIALSWEREAEQEFTAGLRIELVNKRGVLATLANSVTEQGSNIDTIDMSDKDPTLSLLNVTLTVKDRIHLARIIKRLRVLDNIVRIHRL